MPPKKPTKRKAANGYNLPDPIPAGEIVRNVTKESWRVGKSIGVGGFGEIYLCSEDVTKSVGDDATLAMKIEPHENGPLFVEMNFYMRSAKAEMVEEFRKIRGLKSFGMPILRGSGNHTFKGQKYRFLVMDRYSKDLDKYFQGGKEPISPRNAVNIAIKVLNVLEYIHSKGYLHNDVKAQNLLFGYGHGKENDIFLVDFGLVSKYIRGEDREHIEYKPDPRFAHDGTIEYLSRDAHIGTKARRSDLEVLGYNLVHWISGNLPWLGTLQNPKTVQAKKETFMSNISEQLRQCFDDKTYYEAVKEFLDYVSKLKFKEEPNYGKCRLMFEKALKKFNCPTDGKLHFTVPKSPKKATQKSPKKRKSNDLRDKSKSPKKRIQSPKKKITPKPSESSDELISDDSEYENKPQNKVTKKKSSVQSKQKQPKSAVESPSSETRKKIEKDLSLKIRKPTYTDSAAQTSPNFVRNARAAAKAKKAALSQNPDMENFVAKAKKAAINAKGTQNKHMAVEATNQGNPTDMDNPTPAMLALMRKKEASKLEKLSAKKRKPTHSKVSVVTSPGGSKRAKQ